ncbi:MAG: hypothetical protein IH859_01180 [Chloroflexi bacterium]|nr:hypothetical protein [Chloroflexota bacterium]
MDQVFAIGSVPDSDNFILVEDFFRGATRNSVLSSDGRFYASIDIPNNSHTTVEEVFNGIVYPITDPNDSIYDLFFSWNPAGTLLAILQNSKPPEPGATRGDYWVKIYDPESKRFIASYKNVKWVNWSGDGTQILYNTLGPFGFLSHEDDSAVPCIFTLLTQETNCLNFIRNFHGLIYLSDYTFSPNGSKISYAYSLINYDLNQSMGGLCIADIELKTVICPSENIPEMLGDGTFGLHVLSHSWSAEGRYISFIIDRSCLGCDTGSYQPYIVIMDTDTYDYILLNETYENYFPGLWRPPITD